MSLSLSQFVLFLFLLLLLLLSDVCLLQCTNRCEVFLILDQNGRVNLCQLCINLECILHLRGPFKQGPGCIPQFNCFNDLSTIIQYITNSNHAICPPVMDIHECESIKSKH
ncbi:hypothetical protein C8J57DRAFT_1412735 [Mycena rebaudengoi]|nr:hypothetical protein C8J57DRAFT_1412735 [Mycena rebaudengoi]